MSVKERLTDVKHLAVTFPASTAVAVGDLLFNNTGVAAKASAQADQLSEEANQRLFASLFLGVSADQRLATETATGTRVVVADGIYDCTCPSTTWAVGDLCGASEAGSGTALENQQVEKVTDPSLAIGYCVKAGASITTVRCRLISKYTPSTIRAPYAGDADTLYIGSNLPQTISDGDGSTDLTPVVQVLGTAKADSSLLLASFNATNDTTVAPSLAFLKSGAAAIGGLTTVAADEVLGEINFFGADGTDLESPAARIQAAVDATVGTGDMPGRLVFFTTADAGEVLTEAMRITSAQDVRVNNGGGLIVGSTTAQITISNGDGSTDLVPEVQILGTAKADGSLLLMVNSATATSAAAPSVNLVKSAHATLGSNTVVASGEVLGEVNFFGADGVDFESCAVSIRGIVNTTPGAGDMPGRLSIFTSTDAAETPVERTRITGTATLSTLAQGIAGAQKGNVSLAGVTSGVVTLSVADVAGTWTMQPPAAVGSAGQQLTDAGGDGVCTWAAASLGAWKHDLGILDPQEALAAVVKAPTHRFTYNPDVMPAGQWAPKDEMTGIFAEEAPWAMHGPRDGLRSGIAFSPINAFGYARAAIQALAERLAKVEAKP